MSSFCKSESKQPVSRAEDCASSLLDGRSAARIYSKQSSLADNINILWTFQSEASVEFCTEEGPQTETSTVQ